MALITWLSNRARKMEDKDEINELMRQYLEIKLREDIDKQYVEQGDTTERQHKNFEQKPKADVSPKRDENKNRSETQQQQYHGSVNDMYKSRYKY